MLKTATTYITFLVAISCLYYVTYWWPFNVDVLPFLEPQNLILGLIFPLRYSGLYSLGICLFTLATIIVWHRRAKRRQQIHAESNRLIERSDNLIKYLATAPPEEVSNIDTNELRSIQDRLIALAKENIRLSLTPKKRERDILLNKIGAVMLIIFIIYCGVNFLRNPSSKIDMVSFSYSLSFAIASFIKKSDLIPINIFNISSRQRVFASSVDFQFPTLVIFIFISSITAGYSESQSIIHGLRFNYILNRDMPGSKQIGYKIYLGAIKDKFIFSDSLNNEHIIISSDSLKVLRLHFYDAANSKSVQLFARLTHNSITPSKASGGKAQAVLGRDSLPR